MPIDDLSQLTAAIGFDPKQLIGIPFALVGAIFMSIGAQMQHRGVGKVGANTAAAQAGGAPHAGVAESSGLNVRQLLLLFKRPSWVFGSALLGFAIVFQLVSLGFSPLIVVQPIGAVALVMTSVINSRVSKKRLNRMSKWAVTLCVGGIGLFVAIAAFTAVNSPINSADLFEILTILAIVLVIFAVVFWIFRKRASALFYIVGAGVLYGFVATLAKVVITRVFDGATDWLTWACLFALLLAAVLGALFVQNAYSSGPPDLVIAGLTVIDPIVAVTIGIVILDEASQAPGWAIFSFIVAGAIAVVGVFLLSKYHPHTAHELAEATEDLKSAVTSRRQPGSSVK
ncbi:MAG: drug/metabolite transporter (DMT)-like permease [Alpinimonas sp.]|jgi:drug/metabolite transporter (DMT)-like permease